MQNKLLVNQLVLVLAHGLSPGLFKEKRDLMPNLRRLGKPVTVNGLSAHAKAGEIPHKYRHVYYGIFNVMYSTHCERVVLICATLKLDPPTSQTYSTPPFLVPFPQARQLAPC